MTTYEQGRIDRENELIALFDEFDITELIGGGYILMPRLPKPKTWEGVQHKTGSLSSYMHRGCRCDACKKVMSDWQKSRVAKLSPEDNEARLARNAARNRVYRERLKQKRVVEV